MKIYFAGSIRGGRSKVADYKRIIDFLKENNTVLTEHLSDSSISGAGEDLQDEDIFSRDINMIKESDIIIAEVTVPSLGVGYEAAIAETLNKPVYCLFNESESENKLSAMMNGNPAIQIIRYQDIDELIVRLKEIC